MKEERSMIPENDDEAAAGHNDIALFFEQTVFLVSQAFNSLDDQRRLRQSSTLVDNNARVKEVLREQTLEMDSIDNMYLFEVKFEEKLSKIMIAKQKSNLSKTMYLGWFK